MLNNSLIILSICGLSLLASYNSATKEGAQHSIDVGFNEEMPGDFNALLEQGEVETIRATTKNPNVIAYISEELLAERTMNTEPAQSTSRRLVSTNTAEVKIFMTVFVMLSFLVVVIV